MKSSCEKYISFVCNNNKEDHDICDFYKEIGHEIGFARPTSCMYITDGNKCICPEANAASIMETNITDLFLKMKEIRGY